jgi:hypothetical protein
MNLFIGIAARQVYLSPVASFQRLGVKGPHSDGTVLNAVDNGGYQNFQQGLTEL